MRCGHAARLGGATLVALLACACGRFGFDRQPLVSGDAGMDAASGPRDAAVTLTDAGSDAVDAGVDAAEVVSSDAGVGVDAGGVVGEDAGPCSESPCRLVAPQCGCFAGQMCQRATAGSAVRTCVAAGATPVGGGCAFSTACVPGATCIRPGGIPQGQCESWCFTGAECGGGTCMRLALGTDVGSCSSACDPSGTALEGCPAGLFCRIVLGERLEDMAPSHGALCSAPGGAAEGGACPTSSLDCAPGLYCAGAVCRRVCSSTADCIAPATCVALSPAFRALGYCM